VLNGDPSRLFHDFVIPFSTYARPAGKQNSVLSMALPCSSPYLLRLPVEAWNMLQLENPAPHLLKDPLW